MNLTQKAMLECFSDSTEMPRGSRTPRTKRCEFEGCTEVFEFETIEQFEIMLQNHKEAVHPTTNQYPSMDESTRGLQLLTDTSEKDWSRFESKFKQYRLICELEGKEVIGHRIVGGRANSKVRKDVLGSARMNLEKCIKYIKEMEYGCSRKDFTDREVIIDSNQQEESGCSPGTSNNPAQNEQLSKGKRKSRAPNSCDITKRKKDNLAERKQGDKAKVRSKVNNGAGKRRLGTPDSYDEKRARQNRESVKKCKLKLKLEAEKVKEKVAELRKEKENLEVIFSCGKESGHNTNCLQEDTSCTLTTIEAPHDVPADQNTEIEIGKQHSKRELKNMREKNRYHKEKANRRENQIELKKLQEDIHRLYAYINANHPTSPQNEEWQQATTSHQVSPSIPKLACSGRN